MAMRKNQEVPHIKAQKTDKKRKEPRIYYVFPFLWFPSAWVDNQNWEFISLLPGSCGCLRRQQEKNELRKDSCKNLASGKGDQRGRCATWNYISRIQVDGIPLTACRLALGMKSTVSNEKSDERHHHAISLKLICGSWWGRRGGGGCFTFLDTEARHSFKLYWLWHYKHSFRSFSLFQNWREVSFLYDYIV